MRESTRQRRTRMAGVGALAATVGLAALAVPIAPAAEDDEPAVAASTAEAASSWRIRATGARIIGGYGDNFDYDGSDVRALEGEAVMTVEPEQGFVQLEIEVRTTDASGPIRFSREASWDGRLRIVQRFDAGEVEAARVAQDVFLHGDTGREAPVMPKLYNYFATWGPAKIWLNGEEAVPMIGSHTMFTEEARGETGMILDGEGTVYSPALRDKEGFTDPRETEFHFVAHTTEPDQDNFPPHSAWIHLHFSEVEVVEKPEGIGVPYILAD